MLCPVSIPITVVSVLSLTFEDKQACNALSDRASLGLTKGIPATKFAKYSLVLSFLCPAMTEAEIIGLIHNGIQYPDHIPLAVAFHSPIRLSSSTISPLQWGQRYIIA